MSAEQIESVVVAFGAILLEMQLTTATQIESLSHQAEEALGHAPQGYSHLIEAMQELSRKVYSTPR